MKNILFLVPLFFFASCNKQDNPNTKNTSAPITNVGKGKKPKPVVVVPTPPPPPPPVPVTPPPVVPPPPVVVPPVVTDFAPIANGTIISGKMQSPVPLYLTTLQSPAQFAMNQLFDEVDTAPEDFYGAMFGENITYHDFPSNLPLPIIEKFEMGNHFGSHEGREFRIFGLNLDNTEKLLATYINAGTYYLDTPRAYKRLKYSVRANARPNFLKVFATHQPYTLPEVSFVKYPLGNHMGTNIHPYSILENPNNANIRDSIHSSALDMCKKMGRVRIYVDNVNISIGENDYVFDNDRQGYGIDKMMQQLKAADVHVVWCMQGLTQWIASTYPDGSNYERLPIKNGVDRLNPASWTPFAEIGFQVALRYGSNPNASLNDSKSRVGLFWQNAPELGGWTKKVSLGYLIEIEPYNEIDKWWKGLESYATGHEMAVAMNVIYQRIKDADPNMKVTYPGLASFTPEVLKEFVYWSMKLYGRIPVDNYAYHAYPSTSGGQYTGSQSVGAVPELWDYPTRLQTFRKTNQILLGNKPFDCGEIGFDATQFSPLRAVVPTGSNYTQREWAAILYSRVALYHAKNGVRATYHYQYHDNNIADQWTQFAAMGMVENSGTAPNIVHAPKANLFMLAQIKNIAGQYTHSGELSASPLIDKWVYGSSVIYSAYNPTENNSSSNYDLVLPTGTNIQIIELSLNSLTPTITNKIVSGGKITINCSEKPKFIKIL